MSSKNNTSLIATIIFAAVLVSAALVYSASQGGGSSDEKIDAAIQRFVDKQEEEALKFNDDWVELKCGIVMIFLLLAIALTMLGIRYAFFENDLVWIAGVILGPILSVFIYKKMMEMFDVKKKEEKLSIY